MLPVHKHCRLTGTPSAGLPSDVSNMCVVIGERSDSADDEPGHCPLLQSELQHDESREEYMDCKNRILTAQRMQGSRSTGAVNSGALVIMRRADDETARSRLMHRQCVGN